MAEPQPHRFNGADDRPSCGGDAPGDGCPRIQRIEQQLAEGARRMAALEAGQRRMRAELAANTSVTTEIRDLLTVGKSGLRIGGWVGSFVKWAGGIAAGVAGIWALARTFGKGG